MRWSFSIEFEFALPAIFLPLSEANYTGSAYYELGYNEHLSITSRFLCMKIIDCNEYNDLFTRCKWDPVQQHNVST